MPCASSNAACRPIVSLSGKSKEVEPVPVGESLIDRQLQTWAPEAEITIVYLPSIVSPYQWQDPVRIHQTFPERGISETTLEANNARSELLRSRIGTLAVQHALGFVDTTPTIAEIAQKQVLHGPVDWRHFNDAGYRVIADLIGAHNTAN